jgi:CheY-like chemotaxis protein
MSISFLLISDEETSHLDSLQSLTQHTFKNVSVDYVQTNERALAQVAAQAYDAIFYDIGMDGKRAYETSRQLREAQPNALLIATSMNRNVYFGRDVPKDVFDDTLWWGALVRAYTDPFPLSQVLAKKGLVLEPNV